MLFFAQVDRRLSLGLPDLHLEQAEGAQETRTGIYRNDARERRIRNRKGRESVPSPCKVSAARATAAEIRGTERRSGHASVAPEYLQERFQDSRDRRRMPHAARPSPSLRDRSVLPTVNASPDHRTQEERAIEPSPSPAGLPRQVTRYTEYYHDDFNILLHDDAGLQKRLEAFKEAVLAVAFAAGIEETRCRAAEDHVANHQESTRAIAALRDAVASLERADQNVLVLLVCKKLDLQGIADEPGLRHKTSAWRRVQYVLKRLREHLLAQGITRAPPPATIETGDAGIEEWLPPDLVAMRPRRTRKEA